MARAMVVISRNSLGRYIIYNFTNIFCYNFIQSNVQLLKFIYFFIIAKRVSNICIICKYYICLTNKKQRACSTNQCYTYIYIAQVRQLLLTFLSPNSNLHFEIAHTARVKYSLAMRELPSAGGGVVFKCP